MAALKVQRGGPYWLPTRRAPFGRRAGQPSEGAPTGTARSPRASERGMSPFAACWEKSARLQGLSKNPNTESCDLFHPRGHTAMARNRERSCGSWRRRRAVRSSGKRGQTRVGWYACPRRTLFATEWSAARRKRPTAAVLHFGAAISANLKAVRFRRAAAENFRPEIFEARATLRSQRESAVGRRSAPTLTRPRLPEDRTARLRHRNP